MFDNINVGVAVGIFRSSEEVEPWKGAEMVRRWCGDIVELIERKEGERSSISGSGRRE